MATSIHNDHAFGASLGRTLSDLRTSLVHRFIQMRTYRSTLNDLAQLSDRDLADIGVHRANLGEIARDAAYRA